MPVTTLDPHTALIVIDLQKGIASLLPPAVLEGVVERSRALADAFRAAGLPVVLVNVEGLAPGRTETPNRFSGGFPAGFTDLLPELDPRPTDILVTKRTWGAFASSNLERRLRALGVTQVVVTGVATSAGVESTARQAYEAGFNVTLALDAMADPRPGAHEHSVSSVFPRLGETGTAADIVALLNAAR